MAKTPDFKYAPMFQIGEDKTEYRLISNEKISRIQLYPTEFEKTPKRSIKRYLYNSIAVD